MMIRKRNRKPDRREMVITWLALACVTAGALFHFLDGPDRITDTLLTAGIGLFALAFGYGIGADKYFKDGNNDG